ncbi:hypothetical protein PCASD_18193 [Puccinia coronata f. sp. avenae]|uniref:Uncharacterized protein n=1 Tax=Puccinia coronata f. sp. avenae TaxID=200324 RepID=A0A2N5T2B3_9BASI|nr:hypothetical protein PCASD_18193 [Puccinia coronata f. sp. avenae]
MAASDVNSDATIRASIAGSEEGSPKGGGCLTHQTAYPIGDAYCIQSIRVTLRRNLRSLRVCFKAARLDAILNDQKAEVALAKFLQDSQRFPDQFPK